jgi:hypothetical protein
MARFLNKIVSKVSSVFQRRAPTARVATAEDMRRQGGRPIPAASISNLADLSVPAHRGAALGSSDPEQMDVSEENQLQWRHLTGEAVYHFIHDEAILFVHSTNVLWAKYKKDGQELILAFKNRKTGLQQGVYSYTPLSLDEIHQFLIYLSKGGFTWDVLRVRGTKHGHRKHVKKLA